MKRGGVLALQGAVSEHLNALAAVGVTGVPVGRPQELDGLDALIIPGGESTAISRLIRWNALSDPIRAFAKEKPVLGTCAGLILCATEVVSSEIAQKSHANPAGQHGTVAPLGLLPLCASRNGFGRQTESFELDLDVEDVGENIPAVFIRAPYIAEASSEVTVMARVEGKAVMARYGAILVTAFHPELTGDLRIMEYFCRMI